MNSLYCKNCKTIKSYRKGRVKLFCKKCHAKSVSKSRRKLKQKAINYLGGKCSNCGYKKCGAVLEFHHKNPKEKDHDIFNHSTKGWNTILPELKKCILLCANCHREHHFFIEETPDLFNSY